MKRLAAMLAPSTLVFVFACDSETLRDVTRIDDLRVIGVRAEPPEVPPGAEVHLDALVVDPLGGTFTYRWYACLMRDVQGGFFGGGSETATSGGQGTAISTDPFGGSCEKRVQANAPYAVDLGPEPTARLTIPADLFDGDDVLRLAYGLPDDLEIPTEAKLAFLGIAGINYTAELVVEGSRGKRIVARKRVNISAESPVLNNARNTNPTPPNMHIGRAADIDTVPVIGPLPAPDHCFSQGDIALVTGVEYLLMPLNVPEPRPTYVVLLPGTSGGDALQIQILEETYFYSFFATAGRIGEDTAKVPGEPGSTWRFGSNEAGPVTLWVVLRDGRGGLSWCRDDLLVQPAPE